MSTLEAETLPAPNNLAQLQHLPVGRIEPSPLNPRKTFDEHAITELAESIREHGLLHPLVVRSLRQECPACRGAGMVEKMALDGLPLRVACERCAGEERIPTGRYEIIAGERRWRALKLLGRETAPALLRDDLSDVQVLSSMMHENSRRRDLNPVEEAEGLQGLLDRGMTQAQVAELMGVAQPTVANTIALLRLPPAAQELVRQGKLRKAAGQALARFSRWPEACALMAGLAAKKGTPTGELEKGVPFNWDLEQAGHAAELGYHAAFEWESTCKGCAEFRQGHNKAYGYCFRPACYAEKQAAAKARKQEAQAVTAEGLRAQYLAAKQAATGPAIPALVRPGDTIVLENGARGTVEAVSGPWEQNGGTYSLTFTPEGADPGAARGTSILHALRPGEDGRIQSGMSRSFTVERAAPAEEAAAPPEAPALPDTEGLSLGAYRWMAGDRLPTGCTGEACEHYALMTTRGANPRPHCLRPSCYDNLNNADGERQRAQAKERCIDRLGRAREILDERGTGVRRLALRCHLALHSADSKHIARAAQELGLPAELGVVLVQGFSRYATTDEQLSLLESLSPETLTGLPVLARLLAEAEDVSGYRGSPYTAWLLGEPGEEPAKLNVWANIKDRKAIDAARVAAGLPPIGGKAGKKGKNAPVAAPDPDEPDASEPSDDCPEGLDEDTAWLMGDGDGVED